VAVGDRHRAAYTHRQASGGSGKLNAPKALPSSEIPIMASIRLTEFTHGGGCGCKMAPGLLARILALAPQGIVPPDLLVGMETSDDAAVYRISSEHALVATTDFFTPIVDDPRDFGRIAATNALSDVYAMGAAPILALALVGMPVDRLPAETIGAVLAGGAEVCREAGIPIAGGHSIDLAEPVYGLVALGLMHPRKVRRNADGRHGDALVLGKPLGIGILSAALKRGRLGTQGYEEMLRHATQLNRVGPMLAELPGVHAMTDVTGFGLAGHLLEICRASRLDARAALDGIPRIAAAERFVREGIFTGASTRNWSAYGAEVRMPPDAADWLQHLVSDPQTSGGLLVSCAPDATAQVLQCFRAAGFAGAAPIGHLQAPAPGSAPALIFE
jgi:selenide,water dikinase